jgi:hypothetical protein
MDARTDGWTPDELRALTAARELEIASAPTGRWVPIWVVVVAGRVFVRTWRRRSTGWYGRAVASGRAWIRVSGSVLEVAVARAGAEAADAVNAAYRGKYGTGGAACMVTTEAEASTLSLAPARPSD